MGPKPDDDQRERLRNAGAKLALWDPIDDHTLRFQLNRALADDAPKPLERRAEREPRVPTNLPVRVKMGPRVKQATIYSLSASGAYLATPCPSTLDAWLEVTLPLPSGVVTLLAIVVQTNVVGNVRRENLPDGMGVRFTAVPPEVQQAIRNFVERRERELVLSAT